MERNQEMKYKVQQAEKTKILSLPSLNLMKVPEVVWGLVLVRLDLSRNSLTSLPATVSRLSALQQLWVNDNPIPEIPAALSACKQLRIIDARHTLIKSIPRDLSLLTHLVELNLDSCPLKPSLAIVYNKGMAAVFADLRRKYDRKEYKNQLFQKLRETMYPEADPVDIMTLTCDTFNSLKDVDSSTLKLFLHNTTRIFPEQLAHVNTSLLRTKLDDIRQEMSRKAEMSKLKLRLKARYPTQPAEQLHLLSSQLTASFSPEHINTIFKEKMLAKDMGEVSIDGLREALERHAQTTIDELGILQIKLTSKLQNIYGEGLPSPAAEVLATEFIDRLKQPKLVRRLVMETEKFLPEDRSQGVDVEAVSRRLLAKRMQSD